MRIWSLHPTYLDTRGLLAVWRETLLAKHVLEGKTKGYKNHPQLVRFKQMQNPLHAINNYLSEIYKEAESRNYHFDESKIDKNHGPVKMTVTSGQLAYEMKHLLKKLETRDKQRFEQLQNLQTISPVAFFEVTTGDIEPWEVLVVEKQNRK